MHCLTFFSILSWCGNVFYVGDLCRPIELIAPHDWPSAFSSRLLSRQAHEPSLVKYQMAIYFIVTFISTLAASKVRRERGHYDCLGHYFLVAPFQRWSKWSSAANATMVNFDHSESAICAMTASPPRSPWSSAGDHQATLLERTKEFEMR